MEDLPLWTFWVPLSCSVKQVYFCPAKRVITELNFDDVVCKGVAGCDSGTGGRGGGASFEKKKV